jgi:hypothetical protein
MWKLVLRPGIGVSNFRYSVFAVHDIFTFSLNSNFQISSHLENCLAIRQHVFVRIEIDGSVHLDLWVEVES